VYTLLYIAVLTGTVLALAKLTPAVLVRSTGSAVAVAVVFSLLNWAVGWLIAWLVKVILFIPALLTLGLLFLFVPLLVNAVLLWITDKLLESFELRGAKALWTSAFVITLVSFVLELATRAHDLPVTRGIWA
jgi:putative membrane protein